MVSSPPANNTEKLQHELEDQYEQSMQHRLAGGRRGHVGLGYHEADKATDLPKDSDSKDKDSEKDGGDASPDKKGDDKDSDKRNEEAEGTGERLNKKRESTDSYLKQDIPDEKKMKFVKGSS